MTPNERRLLVETARIVRSLDPGSAPDAALIEVVERGPQPLTPRAKYVSILTADFMVRNVAARWHNQHFRKGSWITSGASEKHAALVALGAVPRPDEVVAIIGNKSWSHLSCDGCPNEVLTVVRIEGPYGDGHAYCFTCIREAAALLDSLPLTDSAPPAA